MLYAESGVTSANQWAAISGDVATRAWPATADDLKFRTTTKVVEDLRELIAKIEAEGETHPQWDTLQQLRDELAALTGTKPGENEE